MSRLDGAVLSVALVVALLSARFHAGSANDGSRLAAVEALVDHGTLAIDRSIFVTVPATAQPYDPERIEAEIGTIDRIKVGEHFYSDKPYTPALFLAGCYWLLQCTTGLVAAQDPASFCWLMTLCSSGLAYVVAVWAIHLTQKRLHVDCCVALWLTASFALGTLALPYCQHVNSHIVLLALASVQMLLLARDRPVCGHVPLLCLGSVAGLGYAVEQGIGQLFWGWTLLIVWLQRGFRSPEPYLVLAASLPWLALHHVLNYAIAGTWTPANAIPEHFDYPGSHFDRSNLTGIWTHPHGLAMLVYMTGLLISDRGFLCFNMLMWLLLVPARKIARRPISPALLFGLGWACSTYLLYAVLSSNYSGSCLSIRWFVPLLAPAWYVLGVTLRAQPERRQEMILLSVWSMVQGALMAYSGMWSVELPWLWVLLSVALGCWLFFRRTFAQRSNSPAP